jgi:hypothetical protein
MAHFAKLDENNIVLEVNVVNNATLDFENEEASGIAFLTEWSGGHTNWKQTSFNTVGNKHINNGSPFRGNYAGVGYKYDLEFDVFIPPRPYLSWKLNYETFQWEAPTPMPDAIENYVWRWSEINKEWVKIATPLN